MQSMREKAASLYRNLQDSISRALEELDGREVFRKDEWERSDLRQAYGGGGESRILENGAVFEQAGVNFSKVEGFLPAEMTSVMIGSAKEEKFFASGVSLVIHPYSPMVPTTHANFRYLEVGEGDDQRAWFGGGMDLTPYYLFEEDARHFHKVIKASCDRHNPEYYNKFKKWCDEYFYLPHRKEARGIGGCFFDYLGKEASISEEPLFENYLRFQSDIGNSFLEAYLPIVNRRKETEFTEQQKSFQLLRRGRYVEFNLIYDRGTLFGLKTGGRTESILMSLPPQVSWKYNDSKLYAADSAESRLLQALRNPREWV